MNERPRVVAVEMTCDGCPSQWEGKLDDGRFFYGRYRWSYLTLGFGANHHEAVLDGMGAGRLPEEDGDTQRGDGWDGFMSTEEFAHRTSRVLDWSGIPEITLSGTGE